MLQRPERNEYEGDFGHYIGLVPAGDLLQILADQLEATVGLLNRLTEEQALYRYAPDKWSIKQVIGHMSDTERVMSYRLLRIARGDKTPLPGFDQDVFINGASSDQCSLQLLLEELAAVRHATLALLKGLTAEAWLRQGTASECVFSVRALACVIAGHELHHYKVLQERYGL